MNASVRPPTPLVVWLLTASIVAAYVAYAFAPAEWQRQAEYTLALIPERFHASNPYHFQYWWEALAAIVGSSYLHLGWWHLGLNAFFLFGASRLTALRVGAWRYLAIYFVAVGAGSLTFLAFNWDGQAIAVGASGGVCGMFTAFFFSMRPTWREALADPQVRGPLGGLFLVNVVLMGLASEFGIFPIAWEGHLGGFIGGGVAYALLESSPRRWRG